MIWILLVLVLGAAGWVWYRVQNDESGAFSCCGCGRCAAAGECVMHRRVKREKGEDPS